MAYVGNPIDTQNTFQSLVGKRFDGDGSTTDFTLDVAPGSTLDIEVFVANVRQDPNSAYTLSGTTLSFSAAPASGTNNIYVVHQAKSVGTIDVPSSFLSDAQTFSGGLTSSGTTTISGALTASAGVTLSGTTPTLTIGDAGAEDTKIVFDGNAQDFHIGLDDSADDLVIGLGSALGTTTHMAFDETGAITKPLQPAFFATITAESRSSQNSLNDQNFATEVFDNNADYNTTNKTFTAPVTGRYQFNVGIGYSGISEGNEIKIRLATSNRNIESRHKAPSGGVGQLILTVLTDMDASDTAKVQVESYDDASVEYFAERGGFSGYLVA